MVITVPAKNSWDYQRHKMWLNVLVDECEKDWHYHGRRVNDKEMQDLLKEAGLVSIELFHLGVPLRGRLYILSRYLKAFFSKPSIDVLRGFILESAGIFITRLFKFLPFNFIFERISRTLGYYLFSKSNKTIVSEIRNTNIMIKSYSDLYNVLTCPVCHKDLHRNENFLFCDFCNVEYALKDNVPFLTISDAIRISK